MSSASARRFLFFFNDTATTEIYTLSLHDALPIWDTLEPVMDARMVGAGRRHGQESRAQSGRDVQSPRTAPLDAGRSEEHTSELQSRQYLVCRLLLEKKTTTFPRTSTCPTFSPART